MAANPICPAPSCKSRAMTRRAGILVVNRPSFLRSAQGSGALSKRVAPRGMTHEEVFRQYRGFDGDPWTEIDDPELQTDDGLAELGDVGLVQSFLERVPNRAEWEAIVLVRADTDGEPLTLQGWRLAGFDLGYFRSEWSHFSVVLNEIIYGSQPELTRFISTLNEHWLLPTHALSREAAAAHALLATAGADVEEMDDIESIQVFIR
jgi:hypothetical protein